MTERDQFNEREIHTRADESGKEFSRLPVFVQQAVAKGNKYALRTAQRAP